MSGLDEDSFSLSLAAVSIPGPALAASAGAVHISIRVAVTSLAGFFSTSAGLEPLKLQVVLASTAMVAASNPVAVTRAMLSMRMMRVQGC